MKQITSKRFLTILIAAAFLSCWAMIGCSNKNESSDDAQPPPPTVVPPPPVVDKGLSGQTDLSFNKTGSVIDHNAGGGGYHDFGEDLSVDSQNRIVATGASFKTPRLDSYPCMVVWRYKEDGSPDVAFNSLGRVSFCDNSQANYPVPYPEVMGASGRSVLVDSKDRIVVTGKIHVKAKDNQGNEYTKDVGAIWRYTPEGSLDLSFNGKGLLTYSVEGVGNVSFEDSTLYNNNILATGEIRYYQPVACLPNDDHCVSKGAWIPVMSVWLYDGESGAPVSNFSPLKPDRLVNKMEAFSGGRAVSYDSQGRILVAGYLVSPIKPLEEAANLENRDAAVWRFDSRGNLDSTFGDPSGDTRGWVSYDYYGERKEDALLSLAMAKDASILVAGRSKRSRSGVYKKDALIIKYDSRGVISRKFGNKHGATIGAQPRREALASEFTSMVVDDEGRILAAGSVKQDSSDDCGSNYDMFVERYTKDGLLDASFGTDGYTVYKPSSNAFRSLSCEDEFAASIVLDKQGKAVVTGYAYNGRDYDMVVWRVK